MARCLTLTALCLNMLGFMLITICCVTPHWKVDLDFWKGTRIHTGMWQLCIDSDGRTESVGKYPEYPQVCSRHFLRPKMLPIPAWFEACRVCMMLSVFGTGFGMFFFWVAFITDNSKNTGSKYWPAGLFSMGGAVCAGIALSIFHMHIRDGMQFSFGGGKYFAEYWVTFGDVGIVDGVAYKVETWLRYSYGLGWTGVCFEFLSLICCLLADLTFLTLQERKGRLVDPPNKRTRQSNYNANLI